MPGITLISIMASLVASSILQKEYPGKCFQLLCFVSCRRGEFHESGESFGAILRRFGGLVPIWSSFQLSS